MTLLLVVFLAGFYLLFAGQVLYGWRKAKRQALPKQQQPCFSLLIVARNEIENLSVLFNAIENLVVDAPAWELIFVDDHSTDGTLEYAQRMAQFHPHYKILSLPKDCTGKKAGVAKGIAEASYDLLLQTDADCQFSSQWAMSMLPCLDDNVAMVCGPVRYSYAENSFLEKWFALEFLALVGSGIGLGASGFPVYCNAANMAYKKVLSQENSNNLTTPSGDDVFLLHAAKKKKQPIKFSIATNAIVTTSAPKTAKQFINQRIRWASKAKKYTDLHSILLSLLIFSYNIALLVFTAISVFSIVPVSFVVILWGIKIFADYLVLHCTAKSIEQKKLLVYLPAVTIIYPIYVALVSIYSIFAQYEWKGRILKG